MRGDQLAWQWRVLRTIGASSNELTVAENVRPDGGLYPMKEKPSRACSKSWDGLFCFWGIEGNIFSATFFIIRT